jgi:hypothetical protein
MSLPVRASFPVVACAWRTRGGRQLDDVNVASLLGSQALQYVEFKFIIAYVQEPLPSAISEDIHD